MGRIRRGKLRHKVEVQNRGTATAAGSRGQREDVFVTDENVWASVMPLSGKESEQARAIKAEVTHRINMRYTSNVTADSRIKQGSRIFNVEAVLNSEERNVDLVLLCTEEV